ncbi:hypothetical protein GQR58_001083 [Nymphon striatum]|nr:hypothetical protein GQR58_001083 [Nymphon striatum]
MYKENCKVDTGKSALQFIFNQLNLIYLKFGGVYSMLAETCKKKMGKEYEKTKRTKTFMTEWENFSLDLHFDGSDRPAPVIDSVVNFQEACLSPRKIQLEEKSFCRPLLSNKVFVMNSVRLTVSGKCSERGMEQLHFLTFLKQSSNHLKDHSSYSFYVFMAIHFHRSYLKFSVPGILFIFAYWWLKKKLKSNSSEPQSEKIDNSTLKENNFTSTEVEMKDNSITSDDSIKMGTCQEYSNTNSIIKNIDLICNSSTNGIGSMSSNSDCSNISFDDLTNVDDAKLNSSENSPNLNECIDNDDISFSHSPGHDSANSSDADEQSFEDDKSSDEGVDLAYKNRTKPLNSTNEQFSPRDCKSGAHTLDSMVLLDQESDQENNAYNTEICSAVEEKLNALILSTSNCDLNYGSSTILFNETEKLASSSATLQENSNSDCDNEKEIECIVTSETVVEVTSMPDTLTSIEQDNEVAVNNYETTEIATDNQMCSSKESLPNILIESSEGICTDVFIGSVDNGTNVDMKAGVETDSAEVNDNVAESACVSAETMRDLTQDGTKDDASITDEYQKTENAFDGLEGAEALPDNQLTSGSHSEVCII